MTPRKNRPLLWEVSRAGARSLSNRNRPGRPNRPDVTRPNTLAADVPGTGPERPLDSPAPTSAPQFESEIMPLAETDPYGLHLHLRWTAVGVVAAALLVLLIAVFAAGRIIGGAGRHAASVDPNLATSSSAPADKSATPKSGDVPRSRESTRTPPIGEPNKPQPTPTERHEPPPPAGNTETQPAKPVQPTSTETDDEPPGAFKLQPGFSYIVVQHFPKSKKGDAEKAAAFLREHGIPTAVLPGADVRLVVNDPFDTKSSDAKKASLEKERLRQWLSFVKAQGAEYKGGYNFAKAEVLEEN